MAPPVDHAKDFRARMAALTDGGRLRRWEVFQDFCAMAYCALSKPTAGDAARAEEIEERYLKTSERYSAEQMSEFSALLGIAVMAIDGKPRDFLGAIYEDEGFCEQKYGAQFWTPWKIAKTLAHDTIDDEKAAEPVLTLAEPCCGSGRLVMAGAARFVELGRDLASGIWVDATDRDGTCMRMTYIQLAAVGIPGIVRHGNALSLEQYDAALTPAGVRLWGESEYLREKLRAGGEHRRVGEAPGPAQGELAL